MTEREIKVGNDTGEGIKLLENEGRILLSGLWKGRTGKSKKGNWNIFWGSKELFDELIKKYQESEEPF